MALTREELRAAIRDAQDIKIEPVDVPEWPAVNGSLFVRLLSARGKEEYLDSIREVTATPSADGGKVDIKVFTTMSAIKLAAATMCDKDGNVLFGVENMEDVLMLADKSADAMQRVIDKTGDINGFSNKAKVVAKNVSASVTAGAPTSDASIV